MSLAWVDGQSLCTYRHAPNTGSRAVRLALMAKTGEMGYLSVLSAKTWGFYDVLFKGQPFRFQRPYGSYVMENVLFKISFPAEFHSQTGVEAGVTLHGELQKLGKTAEDIKKATIRTHASEPAGPKSQRRLVTLSPLSLLRLRTGLPDVFLPKREFAAYRLGHLFRCRRDHLASF